MVQSHQLHRNTGIVDPLIFSEDTLSSFFHYQGWSTTKNHFIVRKDLIPSEQNADLQLGGKTTFKLSNIADKAGPVQLMWRQAALTTTAGTFRRFDDFLGYCAWQSIALEHSTNEIYTIYPEDVWSKYVRRYDINHQEAIAELVAGDRSNVQRDALATGFQDLIVDLPFPFTCGTKSWMEIMQLAQEPRITVTWRPLREYVDTDGTAPVSPLTNVKLRTTYVHFDNDERDNNTIQVESEDGKIRLIDDFKKEDVTQVAGVTGETNYKINNFRTSTKTLAFIVRRTQDLTTDLANQRFFNLQPVVRFWFEGADGKIIEPIEDRYARFYMWPLHHEGKTGKYLYEYTFALDPDNLCDATGSYNMGNVTNATLHIDWGTVPLAANVTITMFANEYNTVQHVRGDIQKNFK